MATSMLQRKVSDHLSIWFGQYVIRENYRPEWLSDGNGVWLELDFFIEDLDIAIEVQGRQHTEYVPHFHRTYSGFVRQKNRDKIKSTKCYKNRVTLIEIFNDDDIWMAHKKINKIINVRTHTPNHDDIDMIIGSRNFIEIKDMYISKRIRTSDQGVLIGLSYWSKFQRESPSPHGARKLKKFKKLLRKVKKKYKEEFKNNVIPVLLENDIEF